MALSPDEVARYARHIVLHEVGGAGQARLAASRILVIGAGGLGSPALLYLAAAGVGRLTVVDDDAVSLSNLQRQVLHTTPAIGTPKTESARAALAQLNPHVAVTTVARRLDPTTAADLVVGHDLVLDGSDNFPTRYCANDACVAAGVPLLLGALSAWEGQVGLFDPRRGGPCYRCVFPEPPAAGLSAPCSEAGVVGALPGVIGTLMALEAIKHVTRVGTSLRGTLLLFDGLGLETRRIRVTARADCQTCHGAGA